MIYWKSKTNTGRVVYDRKKHNFRFCDVLRIANSLKDIFQYEFTTKQLSCAFLALISIMEAIFEIDLDILQATIEENPELSVNAAAAMDAADIFSRLGRRKRDSGFGGGGASRAF